MQTFLTILGAVLASSVIAAFIGFRGIKAQLKANQAKNSADTALTKSQENAQNIDILKGLIKTLQDEVARSQKAAQDADTAAKIARDRAREAEKRLDQIEADLDQSQEQRELMARQLAAANEKVHLLEQQRDVLLEHARRVDEWWQTELLPKLPTDLRASPPPRIAPLSE